MVLSCGSSKQSKKYNQGVWCPGDLSFFLILYLTTALKVAKNLPCSKTFQNIFFMLEYKVTRSPLFLSETVTREVKDGRELKSFAA